MLRQPSRAARPRSLRVPKEIFLRVTCALISCSAELVWSGVLGWASTRRRSSLLAVSGQTGKSSTHPNAAAVAVPMTCLALAECETYKRGNRICTDASDRNFREGPNDLANRYLHGSCLVLKGQVATGLAEFYYLSDHQSNSPVERLHCRLPENGRNA